MDNNLLDHGMLGEIIDELMSAKGPAPAQDVEELNALREKYINELDDKLATAVFGSLSAEQVQEIEKLLDQEDASDESFEKFFKDANIDVEKIISDTIKEYKEDFLGGENA